jgi:hypothetical protein
MNIPRMIADSKECSVSRLHLTTWRCPRAPTYTYNLDIDITHQCHTKNALRTRFRSDRYPSMSTQIFVRCGDGLIRVQIPSLSPHLFFSKEKVIAISISTCQFAFLLPFQEIIKVSLCVAMSTVKSKCNH